jgi:hypothetical protein
MLTAILIFGLVTFQAVEIEGHVVIFSLSSEKSFDLGNYPKEHTRSIAFPKPGIIFVPCHLQPNMAAIVVRPFAIPLDETGAPNAVARR